MRKSLLILAVPTMALVLAVAALAVVPGILNLPSGLSTASIAAPAWKVGDRWTYNVSLAATGERELLPSEMMPVASTANESFVIGTLTETVVGSVSTPYGDAWNVTLDATLGFEEPRPIILSEPTIGPLSMPAVAVSGFVWLPQSDLAPIYGLKAVHLSRDWTLTFGTYGDYGTLANATYTLTYDATTQFWYHPPLAIWQFPLEENETWNVSSNATIHYASVFQIVGPNVTYRASHSANFTVPVAFAMRTGLFADAATPAGTFHALPVMASRTGIAAEVTDRDASAVMNLTGETDVETPHAFATAWFSAQAGNVVKAMFGTGFFDGPRVELDLSSYTYG